MTHLGTWSGETAWKLYRTGERIDEGGDGVAWRCTCPHGEPQGSKELNELYGYPCRHLRSVWAHAEQGLYDPHVTWTEAGIEAGKVCRCRTGEPSPLRFGPPLQRPPAKLPYGAALNKRCPCGSGRKLKKCQGVSEIKPDGPTHPLRHPPGLAGIEPPAPPKPPDKRRRLAERRAERAERKAVNERRVAVIVEAIRAKEAERRSRRAFLARSKKARAVGRKP